MVVGGVLLPLKRQGCEQYQYCSAQGCLQVLRFPFPFYRTPGQINVENGAEKLFCAYSCTFTEFFHFAPDVAVILRFPVLGDEDLTVRDFMPPCVSREFFL